MEERSRLFGRDLRVAMRAPGLDLVRDASGDIELAEGNDNIVQALLLRLRVRKGELAPLGWPDYGSRLHELIGEPNNSRTRVMLMAHARNVVERDPRVAEVQRIRAEVLPGERDVVTLVMDIALIDAPDPLNLVFDISLEPR
jgi:phage baseplate assembly protein W